MLAGSVLRLPQADSVAQVGTHTSFIIFGKDRLPVSGLGPKRQEQEFLDISTYCVRYQHVPARHNRRLKFVLEPFQRIYIHLHGQGLE
jgi:hypothetical protein